MSKIAVYAKPGWCWGGGTLTTVSGAPPSVAEPKPHLSADPMHTVHQLYQLLAATLHPDLPLTLQQPFEPGSALTMTRP